MKTLTIYTHTYEQALRAFSAEAAGGGRITVRREGRREGLFYLYCAYEAPTVDLTDRFATLLEYVAVRENPVYKHSAKLIKLAQDFGRTPVHQENAAHLEAYLHENRALHLEGYAAFRMAEYRDRLDMLVYSLIKKMKLT